jgi:hypothetical protein
MGSVASKHESLAVVTMTADFGSDRQGDQDVNVEGCGSDSASSTMLFNSSLSAAYVFVRGAHASLNVSAMMQTLRREFVVD